MTESFASLEAEAKALLAEADALFAKAHAINKEDFDAAVEAGYQAMPGEGFFVTERSRPILLKAGDLKRHAEWLLEEAGAAPGVGLATATPSFATPRTRSDGDPVGSALAKTQETVRARAIASAVSEAVAKHRAEAVATLNGDKPAAPSAERPNGTVTAPTAPSPPEPETVDVVAARIAAAGEPDRSQALDKIGIVAARIAAA